MRLWHLALIVCLLAVAMAIARDEIGRIALIIFATAIGEVFLGVTSIMMLFRTMGAFGTARDLVSHVEAIMATLGVLLVGGISMLIVVWFGAVTVQLVV